MAFLAGDFNVPPPSGRPQLLAAGRALEIFIGFPLGEFQLFRTKPKGNRIPELQKGGIFPLAGSNIPGKRAEQGVDIDPVRQKGEGPEE